MPPALALSDLILHGVFDRHPPLRFGVVELSSEWVPQFLLMLDGAADFTTRLNGQPVAELSRRPSEYFLDRVRVSSFSYEDPKQLTKSTGDVFMFCSDYPTPRAPRPRSTITGGWAASSRKCPISSTAISSRGSIDRRRQECARITTQTRHPPRSRECQFARLAATRGRSPRRRRTVARSAKSPSSPRRLLWLM